MKQFLLFFLLGTFASIAFCQEPEKITRDYYISPVKIPVFLAGNFAELRPNHFHGGIDIKTQGRTGLEVVSAAEGFVSRILVSPTGFGRALYIDHPNGTTTVYGHLESFAPQIDDYIRKIQYEKKTFAIDQVVPENLLTVKKGEFIAKSGNAGSSGGPHLHFEIRKTQEEIELNPLNFRFPVMDKVKPTIQSLFVYPLTDEASVNGKQSYQQFEVVKGAKNYQLKLAKPIVVYGGIGFGVKAFDKLDGSPNPCGIYSLKLFVDNRMIYSFTLNEIPVKDTKYANSQLDYALAIRNGQRLYKTWLEPGNHLPIYHNTEDRGIFRATDGKLHDVKYEIADVYGNTSSFLFQIQSKKFDVPEPAKKGKWFKYNRNNDIKDEGIRFSVPEGALYSDVDFQYSKKPALSKFYSPVYQLHNEFTPLHIPCNLRIKADHLPERLRNKVMLAQINPISGKILSATGKYDDGWVEGNIKVLGNYVLAVDTVAPRIVPVVAKNSKNPVDPNTFKLKVTDDLSGIDHFSGTIDGEWVLFEYDLKTNTLVYTYDKKRFNFSKNHQLILEVADFKENTNIYKSSFYK